METEGANPMRKKQREKRSCKYGNYRKKDIFNWNFCVDNGDSGNTENIYMDDEIPYTKR